MRFAPFGHQIANLGHRLVDGKLGGVHQDRVPGGLQWRRRAGRVAGEAGQLPRLDLIVEADPEHIHRILTNLAKNAAEAIRAAGRPGELTITAETGTARVEIGVSDTGPGLPAKAREHLFKPFRGGTRREGTGLGLAIAQELVRANGGELTLVRSTTAGTEFRLVLPASAAIAAA